MFAARPTTFALAALALTGLAAARPAAAQTTLTGTLAGTFYHDPSESITSIAAAQNFIAANSPTGTFTATESTLQNGYGTDSQNEDQEAVTTFLKTDGASYTGTVTNISDGILDFKGFVIAPTTAAYAFATNSDDGSALFVDGTEIVNNDGIHASRNNSAYDTLSAGQHSVEVLYFNHIYNGGQGGADLAAYFGGLATTPSAAPEPSQVAGLGFAALGIAGLLLKARRKSATAAA